MIGIRSVAGSASRAAATSQPEIARHHDVEQDHVGPIRSDQIERLITVGCLCDSKTGGFEIDTAKRSQRGVIVDDQNVPLHLGGGHLTTKRTTVSPARALRSRSVVLGAGECHTRWMRHISCASYDMLWLGIGPLPS